MALALFVVTIYVYDELSMPEGFWLGGRHRGLRRRLEEWREGRIDRRWYAIADGEAPRSQSLRTSRWIKDERAWREACADEVSAQGEQDGPLYTWMVATWHWVFDKSNDAFWWLLPNYLNREDIFAVPGSAWSPMPPDNEMDPPRSVERVNTLRQSECGYMYITGLTETSNPEFPLLADAGTAENVTVYTEKRNEKGGVWRGKTAVILFVDGSGRIMDVNDRTDSNASFVKRPGHPYNIFDNSQITSDHGWLTPANLVLPPN